MDSNFNEVVALAGTFCQWIWKARNDKRFLVIIWDVAVIGLKVITTYYEFQNFK